MSAMVIFMRALSWLLEHTMARWFPCARCAGSGYEVADIVVCRVCSGRGWSLRGRA